MAENGDAFNSFMKQNGSLTAANDSFAKMEVSRMSVEGILGVTLEVLIALFGVIGNALVITVIRKLGKKKQIGDYYLQNLAIADLGLLLLAFPLTAIREKAPLSWPLGEFACRYLYPLPEVSHGASVWFIAVVALERYCKLVALKSPGVNQHQTSQRARIIGACVWVVSFLVFCLPLYFVVEYRELSNGGEWCGPVWPSWDSNLVTARAYIALLTLFSYVLPLTIISLTYFSISRTIRRSSVFNRAMKLEQYGLTEEDKKQACAIKVKSIRLKQNKRARKILTPLVVVFAITMLPLNIFRLAIIICPSISTKRYYKHLMYVMEIFVVLNSSANPVIYSVVSGVFRKRTKNLFHRR